MTMRRTPLSLKLVRILLRLLVGIPGLRPLVRALWPAITLEIGGQRFRLHAADNATESFMLRRGQWREAASIGRLTLLVAGKRALIADIGANCGAYTLPLAGAAGPDSHILAFEPNPVMVTRLRCNLALNALDDHVHVHEVALGSEPAKASLQLHDRNLGAASIRRAGSPARRSLSVPVRPLREFLPHDLKAYDVFVIKCDIEGFEDEALAPWLRAAPQSDLPDAILVETTSSHLWDLDLEGLILERGYDRFFAGQEQNTLFLKHPPSQPQRAPASADPADGAAG